MNNATMNALAVTESHGPNLDRPQNTNEIASLEVSSNLSSPQTAVSPNLGRPQTEMMTSLEIAELTDKRHDHVIRDIQSLIEQNAFQSGGVEQGAYTDKWNRKQPLFRLDYVATMTLVTGYNAVLRNRVIARWHDLETGKAKPIGPQFQEKAGFPPMQQLEDAVSAYRIFRDFARSFGLKGNAARLSALGAMRRAYGCDLQAVMQLQLVDEAQQMLYTPTEMARALGIAGGNGGSTVNKMLESMGLQKKILTTGANWRWEPTAEGKKHCTIIDTTKRHNDGGMVQQIKWRESLLQMLKKEISEINATMANA